MTIQATLKCCAYMGSQSGVQRHCYLKEIVSSGLKISGNLKGMWKKSASETSQLKDFMDPSYGTTDKHFYITDTKLICRDAAASRQRLFSFGVCFASVSE